MGGRVTGPPESGPWDDARLAARLLAIDPAACGGICLRAGPGPPRDRWVQSLRDALPPDAPYARIPLHIGDERLLGGLDIAATVRAGRPVHDAGLVAGAGGGLLVLPMAERTSASLAARLTQAMDAAAQRSGGPRFGLVVLDESRDEEERPPERLLDRLGFHLDLRALSYRDCEGVAATGPEPTLAARDRLPGVAVPEGVLTAVCEAALALGVDSLRAATFAVNAARLSAAYRGRGAIEDVDLTVAARLVLAPRATVAPAAAEEAPPPEREDAGADDDASSADSTELAEQPETVSLMIEAAQAAIPAQLLEQLQDPMARTRAPESVGRRGRARRSRLRGRPAGVRSGQPGPGDRLNIIETLRSAAPWQRLRRQMPGASDTRIQVRRSDFRVSRFAQRSATTTIFAVDASGSAALHRLAEAKGAVELLLADCYVRRDEVSLVAFRGEAAELLLPPTRSLLRAKRALAGLPGGGGTPLASAIQTAALQAQQVMQRGHSPVIVLLTDGRGNIALDGKPDRARAAEEAKLSARFTRALGCAALLVDTSPRPQRRAQELAEAMAARYLPLPYAGAAAISAAAQQAAGQSR